MDWRTLSCSLGVLMMMNACDDVSDDGPALVDTSASTAGDDAGTGTGGQDSASGSQSGTGDGGGDASSAGNTWTTATDSQSTAASASATGPTATTTASTDSGNDTSSTTGSDDTTGDTSDESSDDTSGDCAFPNLMCGSECVDPSNDPKFCGAMSDCVGTNSGKICQPGEVCSGGQCQVMCANDEILCEGYCIDPDTSSQYCGASGSCEGSTNGDVCGATEVCSEGVCKDKCGAGKVLCSGKCIDPDTDANFCGAQGTCAGTDQGTTCVAGDVCTNGTCKSECDGGFVKCEGECIDPVTDSDYCGATAACEGADAGKRCGVTEVCSNGECQAECEGDLLECDGTCVDPKSDPDYCGATGACDSDINDGDVCAAGEVCSAGECEAQCAAGLVLCGGSCIDPKVSEQYCGAGQNCLADPGQVCGADKECVDGACLDNCDGGKVLCDGACIDPLTNNDHCGATGNCSGGNSGSECTGAKVCKLGSCEDRCEADEVLCDGTCVDPMTSQNHCGATGDCMGADAGSSCLATEICDAGSCKLNCAAGLVACGGNCIDPDTSQNFCGAKNECASPDDDGVQCDTDERCTDGLCDLACDKLGSDWIECGTGMGAVCRDKSNDLNNCGSCGNVCEAGELCQDGECEVNCTGGLIKCGRGAGERCVDPTSDDFYCGATEGCGIDGVGDNGESCFGDRRCDDGTCKVMCDSPTIKCTMSDGVERCINPDTNSQFCGASGDCAGSNDGVACESVKEVCKDGTCEDSGCGDISLEAPSVRTDVLLVLDKSGSMLQQSLEDENGESIKRWTALHRTVVQLVTTQSMYENINFGTLLYPTILSNSSDPNGDCSEIFDDPATRDYVCRVDAVGEPGSHNLTVREICTDSLDPDCVDPSTGAVRGAPVTNRNEGIPDSLGDVDGADSFICGATPGTAALREAKTYMEALRDETGRAGAVVMVMDGEISGPGGSSNNHVCSGESWSAMYTLADNLAAGDSGIELFPVGIALADGDEDPPETFRRLTWNGARGDRRADSWQEQDVFNFGDAGTLSSHLNDLLRSLISCELVLDPPPADGAEIEVKLVSSTGVEEDVTDLSEAGFATCEAAGDAPGWVWGSGTDTIQLCGSACTRYRQEGWGNVGVSRKCIGPQ